MKTYKNKTARKTRKTRRTYARRRRTGVLTNWTKRNFPLPPSFTTKLKYVDYFTMDPNAYSNSSFIMSANGMFDPNITGTGHQPYGFDQLMAMYNHYTVYAAKIKVTLSASAGQPVPFWLGVQLRDSNQPFNTTFGTNYMIEQPYSSWKLVPYANKSGEIITMVKKFSLKSFFGAKGKIFKGALENSLFRGDNSSNPSEGAFFHIIMTPYNESADNIAAQNIAVEIEYLAKFTEPRMLNAS